MPTPPRADKKPVRHQRHGRTWTDDYAWLRDPDWQAVIKNPAALDTKIRSYLESENDFITVAKPLVGAGFCAPGEIAIHGGSAGGLLIGAVLNQAPGLFRAALADVPFVDVLNTICDDSLPLTPSEWEEWGNPIVDRDSFAYIAGYSPYDNVAAKNYPAILVTAGISDAKVTYWEPAKWVAKLRTLKTDDNLLLLKTNLSAGHAGAAGRFDYLKEVALRYAFVLKVFGKSDTRAA